MDVKCSANKLNSDYNFLNISARDLILVLSCIVLNSKEYNVTHHLWQTSVGLTEFQNGCHFTYIIIQYSDILALGDPIFVSE